MQFQYFSDMGRPLFLYLIEELVVNGLDGVAHLVVVRQIGQPAVNGHRLFEGTHISIYQSD